MRITNYRVPKNILHKSAFAERGELWLGVYFGFAWPGGSSKRSQQHRKSLHPAPKIRRTASRSKNSVRSLVKPQS
jgi:hypothetical protein